MKLRDGIANDNRQIPDAAMLAFENRFRFQRDARCFVRFADKRNVVGVQRRFIPQTQCVSARRVHHAVIGGVF
jgi:hypothetical protein